MRHLLIAGLLLLMTSRYGKAAADQPVFKQDDGSFLVRHQAILERARKPIGLLFLGDSITQGWSYRNFLGKEVWQVNFDRYDPANFGVGGDRTEHLIWRLTNGEIRGIQPRAVVLLIGTNNTGTHSARQIAAGIRKNIEIIQSQLPGAQILLLGILPRADSAAKMNVIRAVNGNISTLDNGHSLRCLDVSKAIPNFNLDEFNRLYLRDKLHLNSQGYKKVASLIQPILSEFMRGY